MKFDDILREIGEFGRYQKWIYFYTCIPALSVGAFILLNVIVFGIPDHRCKIPGLLNDTWDVKTIEHRDLVNYYIPPSDTYPYDRCHLYIRDNSTVEKSENGPMVKCKEWVFDPSVFKNTLVKQMNLVCDDALMISHAQTVFYAGVLVGNLVFGQLSDLIGRKKTLFSGLMILMASSISLAFVTEYYSFVVIYFIVGTCTVSSLVTAYVIGMEFVGPSKRVWAGYVIMAFCTTGSLYLILMSFLLRDWKLIELSVGIPCIAYIFVICIIPESPRWLLSNGRREEAEHIVVKMAKRNGKCLTDEQLNLLEAEQQVSNGRLWQLFSTRKLALQTLVIFFNWFVVSMAYYGVILNVGNLGGDLYLNLFLITIVEYPGRLISIALLNRIGRKKCYIGFMLLGGIACIGTIYPVVQKDGGLLWLQVTLSVVGKMCVSSGFEVIYILSTELFPTVVRNVGLGTSSACARAGSMVSPYIAQLAGLVDSNVAAAIPLTVFGIAAFLGGLLSLSLPETLDKKLPETIEDAHNLNRKRDQVIVVQAPEKVPEEYKQLLRKKTAEP